MNSTIKIILYLIILIAMFSNISIGQKSLDIHKESFQSPPMDCWPHTRWWWPGNATSKENITYELEQMRSHGIRVEWKFFPIGQKTVFQYIPRNGPAANPLY